MLDIQQLRSNLDAVAEGLAKRGKLIDFSEFKALEAERKTLQTRTQELQAQRNTLSKQIGMLKGQGKDASEVLAQVGAMGDELKASEVRLGELLEKFNAILSALPNVPDDSVPLGSDEAGNGGHPIDLCRYQIANCYMGRAGLINSGGASGGESDWAEATRTAVINKRAGGMGLISGRKAFQSSTRAALPRFEVEEGRLKVNPLADWDKARIETYFEEHDLPPHPLVAQGYPSIGCAPCTSMVKPGEDPRAGRWRGWDKVECGIHTPITDPDDPANLPAF